MGIRETAGKLGSLTIEEVRASGRPALFSAFGDNLAYLDGTIYCLPCDPRVGQLPSITGHSEVYELSSVVGVEYGWYHVAPAVEIGVPQEAA